MNVVSVQVKIGRDGEYVAALQSLRGKNVDISSEATDMKVMLSPY